MWNGEINFGMHLWFGRRVRQTLGEIRDNEKNGASVRHRLADPEIFEWVAEWYEERIADFIRPHDSDTFCVDDIHNNEKVKYRGGVVCNRCNDAVDAAIEALAGLREAQAHPDLDGWFTAALGGKLAWDGPSEPSGYTMVDDAETFIHVADTRQKNWPLQCRTCGDEFQPDRSNVKNCESCRAKRRAQSS